MRWSIGSLDCLCSMRGPEGRAIPEQQGLVTFGPHLPARSRLYVDCGLTIPQHCQVLLGNMDHGEVPGMPNEDTLFPVNHTRGVLKETGRGIRHSSGEND